VGTIVYDLQINKVFQILKAGTRITEICEGGENGKKD